MNKDPKGCEFEYAISKAYSKKIITYGGPLLCEKLINKKGNKK